MKAFLRTTADPFTARYARAYACYRSGSYDAALADLRTLVATNSSEEIQVHLATGVVLYRLARRKSAVLEFRSAQREEARFAHVSLQRVMLPTGGERLLLSHRREAFQRFLVPALAFEFAVKEDRNVHLGVTAALAGAYLDAAHFFAAGVQDEKSDSARWLYGNAAFLLDQRQVALSSWFETILYPASRMEENFNAVEWSAVSLALQTITTQ